MAAQSLYRRVLGAQFDALPEVLRRFHDSAEGGQARGTLHVVRGAGWLRNALAFFMGLPRAGTDVPVHLEVRVEGDRERWVRHLQGRSLETVQWARGELLMEALGATCFSSVLVVDGSRLRYEFRQAWMFGIPLPRWLAPTIDGWVDAQERGWRLGVRIGAPLLGDLVRYEGWVEPE